MVTAIDCVHRVSSAPQQIGLVNSVQFKFVISFEDAIPCRTWIVNDVTRKISDVENLLLGVLEDPTSSCGATVPCMANGQFMCGEDLSLITYE